MDQVVQTGEKLRRRAQAGLKNLVDSESRLVLPVAVAGLELRRDPGLEGLQLVRLHDAVVLQHPLAGVVGLAVAEGEGGRGGWGGAWPGLIRGAA